MRTKMFSHALVLALAAALVVGSTPALPVQASPTVDSSVAPRPVSITLGPTTFTTNTRSMAPGDTQTGAFSVRNTGRLELRYRVTAATAGALFGGATPAVVGGLADDQNVILAPGASATIVFTVTLPTTAGNAYQGVAGTVNFTVTAVQAANALALSAGNSRTNDSPPNPGPAFRVAQTVNGQLALNFGTFPVGNNRHFPQVLTLSNFSDRPLALNWRFSDTLAPHFAPGGVVSIAPGRTVTLGFRLDTKPGDAPGEYIGTLFLSGMDGLITAALPARLRLAAPPTKP